MSLPKSRLPWVDNLRTLAIMLVVCMHACVTYSHVGDWYLMSAQEPAPPVKAVFIVWQGHLQAFFMGLLFFLAGYFAHASLAKRGPAGFMRERLVRLGLPTLFFMLVIHPFVLLGLNPWQATFPPVGAYYVRQLTTGRILSASGPLWFAFALLIFCALLAAWRAFRPEPATATAGTPPPGAGQLWRFGAGLVVVTFLVRTFQPVGTSVMNFQLCFFPQYIAAFVAGLAAARHGWLLALAASRTARLAGWLGLIGGPVALLALMRWYVASHGKDTAALFGGWHWPALGLAAWEQLAGLGLALGFVALFARKLDWETPGTRWLSERSFAVYVFHTPVLVALTMAFRPLEPGNPFLLAALLTVTGLLASYGVAFLARRIPGLGAIL
jgi:glucan biosynthesis protein C